MKLIQWIERLPQGYGKITDGTFHADMEPVLAGLLLKIPNGEYVVNELQHNLMMAIKNNPKLLSEYNLENQIYYTTGAASAGSRVGTSLVPFSIYALKLNP